MVHEMRLFKSEEELNVMRRAGEISARRIPAPWKSAVPVCSSTSLKAKFTMNLTVTVRASRPNTIVGGGENGCILHYTENESELRDGDLVLIDAGCEYQGYAGDITRTFPVNGNSPPRSVKSMTSCLSLWRPR